MKTAATDAPANPGVDHDESWLELVRRQVKSLDYGIVQIVVHESRVVQIERTEKVRLSRPIAGPGRTD